MDEHFDKHIDCNKNPFLFLGSMVVGGQGHMLVTSVGSNTVSFQEALLEALISRPNITPVLFLRFLRQKHE